jgi:hypothetical protein
VWDIGAEERDNPVEALHIRAGERDTPVAERDILAAEKGIPAAEKGIPAEERDILVAVRVGEDNSVGLHPQAARHSPQAVHSLLLTPGE